MNKYVKGLLTVNLASVVRAVRFGPRDSLNRLAASYYALDPFGTVPTSVIATHLGAIPEVDLLEVISSRPLVQLDGTYSYVDGSLPYQDILALLGLLVDRQPDGVLEIGTFQGHTTRLLAVNRPTAVIHTVDLPEEFDANTAARTLPGDDLHLIVRRQVGQVYRADSAITNVVQHYGDTATWDFANATGATFIFIDGAHTYEYVRNDTEKSLRLVNGRRATLVWHDCDPTHPGVTRWLAEMIDLGYPVRRLRGTNLAILDQPT